MNFRLWRNLFVFVNILILLLKWLISISLFCSYVIFIIGLLCVLLGSCVWIDCVCVVYCNGFEVCMMCILFFLYIIFCGIWFFCFVFCGDECLEVLDFNVWVEFSKCCFLFWGFWDKLNENWGVFVLFVLYFVIVF